jgi:LuxR family transcriptional regulator, transcriptional regulator of spore coat protein
MYCMNNKVLTSRENQVFNLLIKNKTTKDIADILKISEKTVRNHISNVIQKLGVKGRAQAVIELIKINEIKI